VISRVHRKLGTAGFIISIVALVVALGGAAYAAGGLTKSQEKQVKKIAQTEAKKYAGKPGANGATGPAGPKGDAGATGAEGKQGPEGKQGTQGVQGREGAEGPEGSPWTAGGVLPAGDTETGTWLLNSPTASAELYSVISIPIPLKSGLSVGKVHYVTTGSTSTPCTGTLQRPTAPLGELCIYENEEPEGAVFKNVQLPEILTTGSSPYGALIDFKEVQAGALISGTWAVTGN
jgi:Collagen triple helix repeat (20 copies)